MNIKEKCESFKMKFEEFLVGCDSIEEIDGWDEMNNWNKDELGEMDVFYSSDLASVIIRLIAIDGKITQKEVDYLNETFGFEYTIPALTELYNDRKDDIDQSFDESFENGITRMRRINNELADAYKDLLALICEIIIESDGFITESEKTEVQRLKTMCQ